MGSAGSVKARDTIFTPCVRLIVKVFGLRLVEPRFDAACMSLDKIDFRVTIRHNCIGIPS